MTADRTAPGRERRILFLLAGVQFTHIVDFMVMMPLGPQFMRLFGISAAEFGLLVSAYTFGAAASALLTALHIDRYGRRRAMLAIYGGFVIATALCGLAPGFWSLLVARAVSGVFGGITGAMVHVIVGDLVPEARRGTATGIVANGFPLAAVAGVPLGLLLGTHFGWQSTFLAVALVGAMLWLLAVRWLPQLDSHVAHARSAASLSSRFGEVLRIRRHLQAFAFIAMLMFAGFSVIPFLSPYLVRNVGLQEAHLSLVYLVGGGATLITATVIGRLSDRHGKARVFRVMAWLSVVPLIVATHLPPVPVPVAIASGAVFMVLLSGRFIPAMALINGAADPRMRGAFLSLNGGVQSVACGVAASLAGLVLGHDAEGRLTHYGLVGFAAVAATLACIHLAGRIAPQA